MKITIFSCENCGGSRLTDSHDACAYCGGSVSIIEEKEERSFCGLALNMNDFVGQDMRFEDFTGATINMMDFVSCNLQGACFDKARINMSEFRQCDLRGATFNGTQMNMVDKVECRTS